MLRLILREGKRITQVDLDADSAMALSDAMGDWAKVQQLMDYLPIFLDVAGKTVIVDGGTTVAARRIERALVGRRDGACASTRTRAKRCARFFGRDNLTHHARVPARRPISRAAWWPTARRKCATRDSAAVCRREEARRAGERGRREGLLRFHHPQRGRARPADHRDLDRRRRAGGGPDPAGAGRGDAAGRLWPAGRVPLAATATGSRSRSRAARRGGGSGRT